MNSVACLFIDKIKQVTFLLVVLLAVAVAAYHVKVGLNNRTQYTEKTMSARAECIVAGAQESEFPLENLPYGVFSTEANPRRRVGVAIGDQILDLSAVKQLFDGPELGKHQDVFDQPTLNAFMSLGQAAWREARERIVQLLRADSSVFRNDLQLKEAAFTAQSSAKMHLAVNVGDYTDFYSCKNHAVNVGTLFRGAANALQPNWLHTPIAYHGRASSLIVSGTPVRRPRGQLPPAPVPAAAADQPAPAPSFGPTREFDFELELGFFVGPSNKLGEPIPVSEADKHIFGCALVNDWSARDVQRWEYIPLGPFAGKNFATTLSPWIVPIDALRPFLIVGQAQKRPDVLAYLRHDDPFVLDAHLEVAIQPAGTDKAVTISRSGARHVYWSMKQQLAHHTANGCAVRPGDLLASGTISGETRDSLGCLLESTRNGREPLSLEVDGKTLQRSYLEDGDEVLIRGWCEDKAAGYRIGFGDCRGVILPATSD